MKKIIFFLVLAFFLSITLAIAKTPETAEQGKAVTKKLSMNMENIAKHLELLGYRIEKNNDLTTDGKPYFIAYSNYENNLIVVEKLPRFIDFRIILITKKTLSADMKDFANRANSYFDIAKMYYSVNSETKNSNINFEAVYIGEYSKELLGSFLSIFKNDVTLIRTMDDYSKVFLNK